MLRSSFLKAVVVLAGVAIIQLTASVKACKAGWGQTEQGACKPCQPGTYSVLSKGNYICKECPVAFYSDKPEATSCKQCPPGLWTGFKGTKSKDGCYPCYPLDPIPQVPLPDGQGGLTCQRCPKGQYASKDGSQCLKCGAGKFILNHISCVSCPPGTKYNGKTEVAKLADACPACGFNAYQPKSGQNRCIACPQGTYSLKTGQKSAAVCRQYLSGKVSIQESITSTERITNKAGCTTDPATLTTTCGPTTLQFAKASTSTRRVITSGQTFSCSYALTRWTSALNKGKPKAVSIKGQRVQCKSYTLYLLPGGKYQLAVTYAVQKSSKTKVIGGKVAGVMQFWLDGVVKSGGGQYALSELLRWDGVKRL